MKEPFYILQVNNEMVKRLVQAPNQPHMHNHEEIIVVMEGTIEHFIDFSSTVHRAPFVSFITKRKVHRIKPIDDGTDCMGYVIRFQSEFVSETIFQLYHFFHNDAHVSFSTNREFDRFVALCKMLHEEAQQDAKDYSIIRSLLSTLLTILESEKRKSLGHSLKGKDDHPFIKFLQLLEENFHQPFRVSFYADKLFMSSRNLNLICQQILQKSASEIIQTRKLLEAKNLLTTTTKSIYEIGYDLGYKEKTYFSNIFRKKTGQSPSEFRRETRALLS